MLKGVSLSAKEGSVMNDWTEQLLNYLPCLTDKRNKCISGTKKKVKKKKVKRMCRSWSLCTLYLHACQVRVIVGDSDLLLCLCDVIRRCLTPLCVDSARHDGRHSFISGIDFLQLNLLKEFPCNHQQIKIQAVGERRLVRACRCVCSLESCRRSGKIIDRLL